MNRGAIVLRAGPVTAALFLALVSLAVVTGSLLVPPDASLLANEGTIMPPIDWRPMTGMQALVLALSSEIPAAILAGFIGGQV